MLQLHLIGSMRGSFKEQQMFGLLGIKQLQKMLLKGYVGPDVLDIHLLIVT